MYVPSLSFLKLKNGFETALRKREHTEDSVSCKQLAYKHLLTFESCAG